MVLLRFLALEFVFRVKALREVTKYLWHPFEAQAEVIALSKLSEELNHIGMGRPSQEPCFSADLISIHTQKKKKKKYKRDSTFFLLTLHTCV